MRPHLCTSTRRHEVWSHKTNQHGGDTPHFRTMQAHVLVAAQSVAPSQNQLGDEPFERSCVIAWLAPRRWQRQLSLQRRLLHASAAPASRLAIALLSKYSPLEDFDTTAYMDSLSASSEHLVHNHIAREDSASPRKQGRLGGGRSPPQFMPRQT